MATEDLRRLLGEGIALRWKKSYADALATFSEVARQAEASGEDDCLADALGWQAVVMALAKPSNWGRVLELQERALAIDIASHGELHPRVAEGLRSLGTSLEAIGQRNEAIEALSRAAELFRGAGIRSMSAEDTLARLVMLLSENGETVRCVDFARELVSVCEQLQQPGRSSLAHFLLGRALVVTGQPKEALEEFSLVLALAAPRISKGGARRLIEEVEEWMDRAHAMAMEGQS